MPYRLDNTLIDYLQRTGTLPPITDARGTFTNIPPALRRLSRICGVGRQDKYSQEKNTPRSSPRMEDVLIGLYGYRIPLVFQVIGTPDEVQILAGTWSPAGRENASATILDKRQAVLSSLLESLYPAMTLQPWSETPSHMEQAGLALGIPALDMPDAEEPKAFPLDRLIRALTGEHWSCLILAEPLDEKVIIDLRRDLIEDMHNIKTLAKSESDSNPLADLALELLGYRMKSLTSALACGAWRTGVYLQGETTAYHRLASLWRGILSGKDTMVEPLRVHEGGLIGELAHNWALPDADESSGWGVFRHPFRYQTLLTSTQLASYTHLPRQETSGFTVHSVPDFDVAPAPITAGLPSMRLGQVVNRERITSTSYALEHRSLTRHAFIAGVTGSGKSNTLFQILKQVAATQTPFLVIEPAKAEYRALLHDHQLGDRLHIFTPGEERVSPFRVNPFEVIGWPNISVGMHLDLLRSVFTASFGMWNPLPQVLERCLQEIFEDRGWEVATNRNRRLRTEADMASVFPTLTDLAAKVEQVTAQLGYEQKVTADLRAALLTRINSLRSGGKGRTLDTPRSLPMEALLQYPCILELQGMGDDDDKAFLMGLLFIRLVEYRRARPTLTDFQHLLVIEEAHRLLTNVGERSQEEGNPRGKAVETFANLLSEIRAYGQGVLVVDQIPTKLAPEVIKNTNLKIAHRIVAADDRIALGGAMAMNEEQIQALSILGVGRAAVFRDGDDSPLLVQVPPVKDQSDNTPPDDTTVATHMQNLAAQMEYTPLFRKLTTCARNCTSDGVSCERAQRIVEEPRFASTLTRMLLSALHDPEAFDRLWPDLVKAVFSREPLPISKEELWPSLMTHAAHSIAERMGARQGWTFGEAREFADRLHPVLLLKFAGRPGTNEQTAWQQYAQELFARYFSPCPACALVYAKEPALPCFYRAAANDLVASERFNAEWREARTADIASSPASSPKVWNVCQEAAYEFVEFPETADAPDLQTRLLPAARNASLCFGQQMLSSQLDKSPREMRQIMNKILACV